MTSKLFKEIANAGIEDIVGFERAKKIISRSWTRRAAVSMVFDSNNVEQASLLMIQRAKHQNDPWSGHMAFPGGRQEKIDRDTLETAKREMFEEVGYNIDSSEGRTTNGKLLGRLSDINASLKGAPIKLVVTPYVFSIDERPEFRANYEVADLVWIPLSQFSDFSQRKRFSFTFGSRKFERPCYQLTDDQKVWGLSLAMIDELLVRLGQDIPKTEVLDRLTS